VARDELEKEIEGAIKIGEVDAKTTLGSDIFRFIRGDFSWCSKTFHEGTVLAYLQFLALYA
jgi:hypothetical protein